MQEQAELDFLEKHKKADIIIYDKDGRLVGAKYLRTCYGELREHPATFYYDWNNEYEDW